MSNITRSINVARGQLEGVARMISENRECEDVLAQMKAARAGLNSAINMYIIDNMEKCLDAGVEEKSRERLSGFIKEWLKN